MVDPPTSTDRVVVPTSTEHPVIAGSASERVVSGPASKDVVSLPAADDVISAETADYVRSLRALKGVAPGRAPDGASAGTRVGRRGEQQHADQCQHRGRGHQTANHHALTLTAPSRTLEELPLNFVRASDAGDYSGTYMAA
jgi:hypothetical protein